MALSAIHPQDSCATPTLRGLFASLALAVAAGAMVFPAQAQAAETSAATRTVKSKPSLKQNPPGKDARPLNPESSGAALLNAVSAGNAPAVSRLLDQGVDPNLADGEALISAALRGDTAIAKILLEKGAKADARGGKALTLAALRGNMAMVELLLDNPWDKADPNGDNHWAISNAARNGFDDIVRKLVAAGADVNGHGGYALANAILGDQDKTAHILLDELKADPNAGNGLSLSMALEKGNKGLVSTLLAKGANSNMPVVDETIATIENARRKGGEDAKKFSAPAYDEVIAMVRKHQDETKPRQTIVRQTLNPL